MVVIEWIESVPSTRRQARKTAASVAANPTEVTVYGMCRATCNTSAAIVPNTATIGTVSQ